MTEPTESQQHHLGDFFEVRPPAIQECWDLFKKQNLLDSLITSANTTAEKRSSKDQLVKDYALYIISHALPQEMPGYRIKVDRFVGVLKSGDYADRTDARKFFTQALAEVFVVNDYDPSEDDE